MGNYKSKFQENSESAYGLIHDLDKLNSTLEDIDLNDASDEEKQKIRKKLSELKDLIHYVEKYRL
jgi:hypothetical protein